MGAVESDSVNSNRKAKDNLHKACEKASETCERTLHGQEQNRMCIASMRESRDSVRFLINHTLLRQEFGTSVPFIYLSNWSLLGKLFWRYLRVVILITYQRFETVPIFPLVYPTAQQIQPIFKLSEDSTSVLSESWRPFTSFIWEKALRLAALGQITINQK